MTKYTRLWMVLLAGALLTTDPLMAMRNDPFSDVPRNHWAYSAVKDAVSSGILEGFDGRFQGNRRVTRYEMARIVQRLLRRMGGIRPGTKIGKGRVTEQDLRNLEALTIEFADELALLNVKVSTLEDNVADLQHDVDALKAGVPVAQRPHHEQGRISGLVSTRLVLTDDGGPANAVGPGIGANFIGNGARAFTARSNPAGVPGVGGGTSRAFAPTTRYSGTVTNSPAPGGAVTFDQKLFLTVAQASVAYDHELEPGLNAHMQVDVDADISTNTNQNGGGTARVVTQNDLPGGDNNVQINELFVTADDVWFGWGLKAGAFALPFSDEHNGRQRTLDWTITPTAQTWRYESWRPITLQLSRQSEALGWTWQVGAFSGLDSANGGLYLNEYNLAANAAAVGPAINTPFTDVPFGLGSGKVFGFNEEQDALGFFVRVADHPDAGGLGWDLSFLTNGGDVNPGNAATTLGTNQEFSMVMGTLDYFWSNWAFVVQAYGASSKNINTTAAGLAGDTGFAGTAGLAGTLLPARGILPNPTGADTDSTSVYALLNYRWNPDWNFTLRYEAASDETNGVGTWDLTALTLGLNMVVTHHSLLQLEYIASDLTFKTNNALIAANNTDPNDDILQLNYKLIF